MNTFGRRLKAALLDKGMTQAELAARCGMSKAAVSQYLVGKHMPQAERIELMAAELGVSIGYLSGADAAEEGKRAMPGKRISVREAAECLGKSDQFVRVGLQLGRLPFGSAVPGRGTKWTYYISPCRFREYVGERQFDDFFGAAQ